VRLESLRTQGLILRKAMSRVVLAMIAMAGFVSIASGTVVKHLFDPADDIDQVLAAAEDDRVQAYREDLERLERWLLARKQPAIIDLLGKPDKQPTGQSYSMPVGQVRAIHMSGFGWPGKHHADFHPIGNVGAVEVWYDLDGETPIAAVVYLARDDGYLKLSKGNLTRRLAWDRRRLRELVGAIADARRGPASAEAVVVGAWATAMDELPTDLAAGPDPEDDEVFSSGRRPVTRRWWAAVLAAAIIAALAGWVRRCRRPRECPSPNSCPADVYDARRTRIV
jgi:hypothetical protein